MRSIEWLDVWAERGGVCALEGWVLLVLMYAACDGWVQERESRVHTVGCPLHIAITA